MTDMYTRHTMQKKKQARKEAYRKSNRQVGKLTQADRQSDAGRYSDGQAGAKSDRYGP